MAGYTPEGEIVELEIAPEPIVCELCGGMLDPILGRIRYGTTIDWAAWIEGNYEHRDRPSPESPCGKVKGSSTFLGE